MCMIWHKKKSKSNSKTHSGSVAQKGFMAMIKLSIQSHPLLLWLWKLRGSVDPLKSRPLWQALPLQIIISTDRRSHRHQRGPDRPARRLARGAPPPPPPQFGSAVVFVLMTALFPPIVWCLVSADDGQVDEIRLMRFKSSVLNPRIYVDLQRINVTAICVPSRNRP